MAKRFTPTDPTGPGRIVQPYKKPIVRKRQYQELPDISSTTESSQETRTEANVRSAFQETFEEEPDEFVPTSSLLESDSESDGGSDQTNSYVSDGNRSAGRSDPVENTIVIPEIPETVLTEPVYSIHKKCTIQGSALLSDGMGYRFSLKNHSS